MSGSLVNQTDFDGEPQKAQLSRSGAKVAGRHANEAVTYCSKWLDATANLTLQLVYNFQDETIVKHVKAGRK